ncbi:MAG: class I SAM-dependent methyltransferase [Nitrospirota bacterium]
MNSSDPIIHDLEIMSQSLNYMDWIYSQFSPYIGERIVELGAGIGNFTRLLTQKEIVVPVDIYGPAVDYLNKRFADNDNIRPLEIDIEGSDIRGLKEYSPDTCICTNVLEHIDDDRLALLNMFETLKPGGHLALLVPAFQFAFGSIDRLVGHRRRYNRKDLSAKVIEAGFTLRSLHYMNFIALPGWFINNRVLKLEKESISQVLFFDRYIVPWLKKIENIISPPFGLSLVAICEKKR